jgi:glycosyltransferase involved in cell wall biosynthesis
LIVPENSPLRIVQLTPGAGKMYCGACLRDNALAGALRRLGHWVVMAPLYLPLTLEDEDQSAGVPIFYNGIHVYLEQHSAFFRSAPRWLHKALASPTLLKWAARWAASTRPGQLGEMTISMLQGEQGCQARELDQLLEWLRQERPDVVCLSNALLVGMARRIKADLCVPVLCSLQGEDGFLDGLPQPHRDLAWTTAGQRAADVDLFIAPSQYFGRLMQQRLKLADGRVRVLFNGIDLEGYGAAPGPDTPLAAQSDALGPQSRAAPPEPPAPVLGYLARMCREKGLETLVDAFILLKQRDRVKHIKLRVGGSCGPADQPLVDQLRRRLDSRGILADAEFHPNLSRSAKQSFLRSLSVFSVPATYGEAFGMYVIEALAAGVPVAQPDHASFPELIAATGGGVLCAPKDPAALAGAIEELLSDPQRARSLGRAGRQAVIEKFNVHKMAAEFAALCAAAAREFSTRKTCVVI